MKLSHPHIIHPEGFPPGRSIQQYQAGFILFSQTRGRLPISVVSLPLRFVSLGVLLKIGRGYHIRWKRVNLGGATTAMGEFSKVSPVFNQTSRLARVADI